MKILAIFTEKSIPRESLEPVISIYRLDTNVLVVDEEAMTEIGSGQYSYDFTAWDGSIDYSVICDSVTLTGSERYAYSAISASPIVEDTLSVNDILRIILAKEVGLAYGGGSDTIEFLSVDNTKTRIELNVDHFGNRESAILDGT